MVGGSEGKILKPGGVRVVDHSQLKAHKLPGLHHQTVAGHEHGIKTMEVWRQTIAPGAETPIHFHDCEEVIVILSGSGICRAGEEDFYFSANSTLVIAPNVVHQIGNTSDDDMQLIAALGMAPVRVKTADGAELKLPWDAP